jgi:hypothetical protein
LHYRCGRRSIQGRYSHEALSEQLISVRSHPPPGRARAEGKKMSHALDDLKKQTEEAETKARSLPQEPERDHLLCDLADFRATLARLSYDGKNG